MIFIDLERYMIGCMPQEVFNYVCLRKFKNINLIKKYMYDSSITSIIRTVEKDAREFPITLYRSTSKFNIKSVTCLL